MHPQPPLKEGIVEGSKLNFNNSNLELLFYIPKSESSQFHSLVPEAKMIRKMFQAHLSANDMQIYVGVIILQLLL